MCYPHRLVASWMKMLLNYFLLAMSLELASQHHDWLLLLLLKMHRNSGHRFFEWFAWTFVHVAIYLCTPTVGSWQRQWVVKAAHHFYSQWRWWSDT
jgi:ABC-type arginine/histidine transport system permease subunit